MKELKIISTLTFVMFFSACYYDVEELIYPTTECDVETMSYSSDIVPILTENCYACHDDIVKFGNIIVNSHSELIKHTINDSFLGAIKHEAGFSPMPQGGAKLLDCEIEKIEAWIDQGSLNN